MTKTMTETHISTCGCPLCYCPVFLLVCWLPLPAKTSTMKAKNTLDAKMQLRASHYALVDLLRMRSAIPFSLRKKSSSVWSMTFFSFGSITWTVPGLAFISNSQALNFVFQTVLKQVVSTLWIPRAALGITLCMRRRSAKAQRDALSWSWHSKCCCLSL